MVRNITYFIFVSYFWACDPAQGPKWWRAKSWASISPPWPCHLQINMHHKHRQDKNTATTTPAEKSTTSKDHIIIHQGTLKSSKGLPQGSTGIHFGPPGVGSKQRFKNTSVLVQIWPIIKDLRAPIRSKLEFSNAFLRFCP